MADQRIQCSEEMVGAGHPTKQDTLNRLMLVEHENDGTHKSGNIHGLEPTDSPEFVTVKLSGLSDGVIPYNVDADTGLADGPTKTDVDDAVTKKHAAVTIDGTSPLSLSTQALSLKNNAGSPAAVTAVDTGTLADSDTVVPTSKAVKTYVDKRAVYYSSDYANLAAFVTAIGATECALVINRDEAVAADTTLPATVAVETRRGCVVTVATGVTLTINGPFEAGLYQVFTCTGTGKVVFGAGAVTEVYAEWWGAVANDATDDYAAVQAAITAITDQEYTSGKLRLLSGIYRIGTTLVVPRGCTIEGSGRGRSHDATYEGTGTVLLCTANTTLLKVDQTVHSLNAAQNHFFRLSNLRLDISTTATSGAYGFDAGTTNGIMSVVTEVNIGPFYIGMYTNGARIWATHMFINNTVNDGVCYVTSDQIYLHAVIVVAAGNNGITCSGLYARLVECETFGCQGWGAKILDGEIIGGYFNNDRLGEIYVYHASEHGRALNITGAVIEFAGKDPGGWFTTNTTAPAIKVETYSSNIGPVNISNVWIGEPQGDGILITHGTVNIVSSYIAYPARGDSNKRGIWVTDGFVTVSTCDIGYAAGAILVAGGYATIGNCTFHNYEAAKICVQQTGGAMILTNNQFIVSPDVTYSEPQIYVSGGVATIMGNRPTPKTTGSGNFIQIDTDGYHRAVYNPVCGWGTSFPSPTLGLYTPN